MCASLNGLYSHELHGMLEIGIEHHFGDVRRHDSCRILKPAFAERKPQPIVLSIVSKVH